MDKQKPNIYLEPRGNHNTDPFAEQDAALNLAPSIPPSGARYVLIYLSLPTHTVEKADGALISPAMDITLRDCPAPGPGQFPIMAILVHEGQGFICTDDIVDLRFNRIKGE